MKVLKAMHSALKNTITGRHSPETRFIILGRSRTGSNLLRGLLNAHSRVTVFEEVFKNENLIHWGLPGYDQRKEILAKFQNDPCCFLETVIFGDQPVRISAVGFKLFYYHAQSGKLQPIWPYLREHTEIKVLHIKRQNILRTHLSRKKAELTDRWINLSGEPQETGPVELSYEECLADFEQTRAWENEYTDFFSRHPQLEVIYERLAADHQGVMSEVFDFLGLPPEPVAPQTYRQAIQPLSMAISNYTELKERFTGTPWEAFFEE